MAKKFAGFKPETLQNKILPALGYNGPTDQASINKFLASSPSAAARMGKFTMAARQMVEGAPIQAATGTVAYGGVNHPKGGLRDRIERSKKGEMSLKTAIRGGASPGDDRPVTPRPSPITPLPEPEIETDADKDDKVNKSNLTSASDLTEKILVDPVAAVSRPKVVSKIGEGTILDSDDAKFKVGVPEEGVETAKGVAAEDVVAPTDIETQKAIAAQSQTDVENQADKFAGAVGAVSDQSTYDATTKDPTQSAVLDLEAAQGEAAQVDAPDKLKVGEGELLDGSSVNQSRIEEELKKTKAASVKDELDDLMKDFEGGDTPAWAAGAMRNANAMLASRGLASTSAAGMAVVQAAMESALPIAKLDAANKQQMAVEKARQRAEFLGIEFDQEFQTKVKNAARISEVANMNFTAEQTIALENARLTNTMNVANLDAKSAKTVADTAAIASLERTNLSAVNKAAADNAQAFLDMDFKNLDNEQEASRVKFQEMANAIIQDTNQKNVIEQANMTEANDAEQLLKELAVSVAKANQNQHNIMEMSNAEQENLMGQFNEQEKRRREEFNAENSRIIETSNAQYKQQVTTDETAAINAAYELEAKAANVLSKQAYDNLVAEAKDLMYYAFQGEQGRLDRANKIATANINADSGGELEKGFAEIATEVVTGYIKYKFPVS